MEKFEELVIQNPEAIKGGNNIVIVDQVVFVNGIVIVDDVIF